MRYKKVFCAFMIFFLCLIYLSAEVSLEEVIQAGRYMFYRDHAELHKYYYIPDQPRLAVRPDGTPEFTFIKYTKTGEDIKGGVVHFLVTWGLTGSEISTAEASLQMIDPEAEVAGPVPFKAGAFKIVSATAGEGGLFNVRICGEGKAPIMPGQKGAVSIALTQEGATLLWESFKNPTSDVSVVFNLTYAGITPAYEAKLKVDWDKVYTHHDISLSGSGIVKVVKLESELQAIFDDLRQKGAIELEVTGQSQEMEKLLETAYGHLIKLMCNTELATDTQIKKSKSGKTKRPAQTIKRKPIVRESQPPDFWGPISQSPEGCLISGPGIGHLAYPALSFAGTGKVPVEPVLQEEIEIDEELLRKGKDSEKAGHYFEAIQYYKKAYKSWTTVTDWEELLRIAKLAEDMHELEIAGLFYSGYAYGCIKNGKKDKWKVFENKSDKLLQAVNHHDAGVDLYKSGSHQSAHLMLNWGKSNGAGTHYKSWYYLALNTLETYLNSDNVEMGRQDFAQRGRRYYEKMVQHEEKYPGMISPDHLEEVKNKIEQVESGSVSKSFGNDTITGVREDKSEEETQIEEMAKALEKITEPETKTASEKAKAETKEQTAQTKTQSKTQKKPAKKTAAKKPTVSKKKPGINPPYNLKLAYTFKRVKMSGHYEVDLRHRMREDRIMVMSGNIGGLYQQYGEDNQFFSAVSLDDPVFQERAVEVILDGQDFEDFKNYINSVSVMFKKERWGAPATTGEIKFFDEQFAEKGNRLTFIYGRGGEGSMEWLDYEYKPKWSFYGGIEWEGDWIKTSDSVITLNPVVEYRTVQISMDQDNMEENGVRAAAFQIKHQIMGKDVLREVIIDPVRGDPLQAEYKYLHEKNRLEYQYKIVWLLKDGREIQSDWISKETPIIYAYYQK